MATYNNTLDDALVLAAANTNNEAGVNLGKILSATPTFSGKFTAVQSAVKKYPFLVDAASQWLKGNSGDLYDPSTATYLPDDYYKNALIEVDSKGAPAKTVFNKINTLRLDAIKSALQDTKASMSDVNYDNTLVDYIEGSKALPYDPAKYLTTASKGTPAVAYKPGMTADQLKGAYGSLVDPKTGKLVFTSQQLEDVANGNASASSFNTKVNSLVDSAVKKSQDWSLYGGTSGSAYNAAVKDMLTNPSKLVASYTPSNTTLDTVSSGSGIDTLGNFAYNGGYNQVDTPEKMAAMVKSYDPNKGVWHAPKLDASGKLVSSASSPYSGILNNLLTGYKDPYAQGYVNQLKMPETPNLTNISKPFDYNPTSADLLALANNTGNAYDPSVGSSLSPTLRSMYMPQVGTNGTASTKPGAPDTTKTFVPSATETGTLTGDVTEADMAKAKAKADKDKLIAANKAWLANPANINNPNLYDQAQQRIQWLASVGVDAGVNVGARPEWWKTSGFNTQQDAIEGGWFNGQYHGPGWEEAAKNLELTKTKPSIPTAPVTTAPVTTAPVTTAPVTTTQSTPTQAQLDAYYAEKYKQFEDMFGTEQAVLSKTGQNTVQGMEAYRTANQPNAGIATNAASITSPSYMNTSVSGPGAPITSLLSTQEAPTPVVDNTPKYITAQTTPSQGSASPAVTTPTNDKAALIAANQSWLANPTNINNPNLAAQADQRRAWLSTNAG